jgi:DNA-binding transcriptional regulator YiaG
MSKPFDIARLRRLLGVPGQPISQAQLAKRLGGVHQACVSRWESGVTKPPKTAILLMEMLQDEAIGLRSARKDKRRSSAAGLTA